MKVFDGKKLAQNVITSLAADNLNLGKIKVAVVSFGNGESAFVRQKKVVAEKVGIAFAHYSYDKNISAKDFRKRLNEIVRLATVDSVIIQLPLPSHIPYRVVNVIPVEKDPDCLSDRAVGRFFNGAAIVQPSTAEAVMEVLRSEEVALVGSRVVLFGYGKLVGRFLSKMLLDEGALLSVVDRAMSPENLAVILKEANVVISAVGSPRWLNSSLMPANCVVVDVGFSVVDEKVVGDIQFDTHDKFRIVSRVPGGVGPMGIAILFRNIVKLYRHNQKRAR